jgi:hypothetical protein
VEELCELKLLLKRSSQDLKTIGWARRNKGHHQFAYSTASFS